MAGDGLELTLVDLDGSSLAGRSGRGALRDIERFRRDLERFEADDLLRQRFLDAWGGWVT
jgi:hypothetical protein